MVEERRDNLALFYDFGVDDRLLLLSTLLHDIGKFWQRTEDKAVEKNVRSMYGDFYRYGAGRPRHQAWGAYFCDRFVEDPQVRRAVLYHHDEGDALITLVRVADWLSAGERDKQESGGVQGSETDVRQMVSPASLVRLPFKPEAPPAYKPLEPLSEEAYPQASPYSHPQEYYARLWERFETQLKPRPNLHTCAGLQALCSLLEEYTSNVPAAYFYSQPDVSLWGHLKTTAAIAFALWREFGSFPLSPDALVPKGLAHVEAWLRTSGVSGRANMDLPRLSVLMGDISGIQDLVYDVEIDGAMRALRGKSFYISYLLWVIARWILSKERLSLPNLLYCGGGHFLILGPGGMADRVEDMERHIDDVLYRAHGGRVAVLLAADTLGLDELMGNAFGDVLARVRERMEEKKHHKFFSLVADPSSGFFEAEFAANTCSHCGRSQEYAAGGCPFCTSFITLGEELVKSEYLVESRQEVRRHDNICHFFQVLEEFGWKAEFSSGSVTLPSGREVYRWALKERVLDIERMEGILRITTKMPGSGGRIRTLDEMAKSASGLKLWGILRGDVDNLGEIFRIGLGGKRSISRIASLSMELVQFFSIELQRIIDEFDNVACIYSGGDDFLLIGRWDKLPEVAEKICDGFSSYCGHNPSFTVSMAAVISPDVKYPVYRVAVEAGECLETAKGYTRKVRGRDDTYEETAKAAFYLFSQPVGWEEMQAIVDIKDHLVTALEQDVSRHLLFVLQRAAEEEKLYKEEWGYTPVWRVFYSLTRLAGSARQGAAKEACAWLLEHVVGKDNRLHPFLLLATRWAEFLTRQES